MPLESIILTVATALSITPMDVYVLVSFLVFLAVFAFLGIERIYSVFFGIVLGIGIFVLLSTLLSPQYQTPETLSLISNTFAKTIIGSSVYLIFILMVLVPMNGNLAISYPKTPLGKTLQIPLLAVFLFCFFFATVIGLAEHSYIFVSTDSAFTLLKSTVFYADFQSSKFFLFVFSHLPTTIILGIGFIIYKLLFADIIHPIILSLLASLKKGRSGGGHEHMEDHGGHDEQEAFEVYEDHGGHHGH